jgi:hypothetical protein
MEEEDKSMFWIYIVFLCKKIASRGTLKAESALQMWSDVNPKPEKKKEKRKNFRILETS